MDYFPFFFDLKNKPCLIVGGGDVATRKARLIAKAGAEIHVVAPYICDELSALASTMGGAVHLRPYLPADIQHKTLVIAATDDEQVNQQISSECHAINIPVNVVDNPKLCSIITPSIVDRGSVVIGISSGGDAPVLARRLRSFIDTHVPAKLGDLAALARGFRDKVKQKLHSEDQRRRFWELALDGRPAEAVYNGNVSQAEAEIDSLLEAFSSDENKESGEVYLVGAGPGDPELLTFKALRLMQKAEVVLYDRLVSPEILDMVRRDADRIYVGKRRAEHAVDQEDINHMLMRLAQQGKRVLRLKGGDPFIFGRGGEEIDLLAQNDIPFQVVPGITAASGCASYAGIPLTHRDYSQSVRFITGHVKFGGEEWVWSELIADNQTLVFYMGLANIEAICEGLLLNGKRPETPVALVEKGTCAEQEVYVSTLRELVNVVNTNEVHAPTLLIIGDVVRLHDKLRWFKT